MLLFPLDEYTMEPSGASYTIQKPNEFCKKYGPALKLSYGLIKDAVRPARSSAQRRACDDTSR